MTIEELIDKAEALNMVSKGIKISVEVEDFDNMKEVFKLSDQQDGMIFEPNGVTRYEWCSFELGDVKFTVSGRVMNDKQLKNYYLNELC